MSRPICNRKGRWYGRTRVCARLRMRTKPDRVDTRVRPYQFAPTANNSGHDQIPAVRNCGGSSLLGRTQSSPEGT